MCIRDRDGEGALVAQLFDVPAQDAGAAGVEGGYPGVLSRLPAQLGQDVYKRQGQGNVADLIGLVEQLGVHRPAGQALKGLSLIHI